MKAARRAHGRKTAAALALVGLIAAGGRESAATSNTTVMNVSGFGEPLQEIRDELPGTTARFAQFAGGQHEFTDVEDIPRLGPLFNSRSCGSCHFQPALGGSGAFISEVRIRRNPSGGPLHIFATDNMLRAGPQTQGLLTFFDNGLASMPVGCQLTAPRCGKSACQRQEAATTTFTKKLVVCDPTSRDFNAGLNCVAQRQSQALFGLGFVEAVDDATFDALAASQPISIRGTVRRVDELGRTRVARFGWKDDMATLRGFAGVAYINEMGITNPDNPTELSQCALNVVKYGVVLDHDDEPEDEIDNDGRSDTDRFVDFMRALDAPPPLQEDADAQAGHALFDGIGCGGCHVDTLTTAAAPSQFVPPTTGSVPIDPVLLDTYLGNKTFHPFSDFLLHDMGSLGDGITSGAAGPRLMRTAPLWGVRAKSFLLHDGRARTIEEAVAFHDGQAAAARDLFAALGGTERLQVTTYLNAH